MRFLHPLAIVIMLALMFSQTSVEALGASVDISNIPFISNLYIFGYVGSTESDTGGGGSGLADVKIYASLANWSQELPDNPAILLATTNEHGLFIGRLTNIMPGTWIRVWAMKDGYTFSPRQYVWKHTATDRFKFLKFTGTPEPPPSLTIQGHVWLKEWDATGHRKGLANVNIYAIFAPRNSDLVEVNIKPVAVTDENGYYRADLGYVPPNSWVMVWAGKENFTFEPPHYVWQHREGDALKTLNFLAIPNIPPPELLVEGHVWLASPQDNSLRRGLPDVQILATFPVSTYEERPSVLIRVGVTNENGFYEGSLGRVPAGTAVRLWAVKGGYTFDPNEYTWVHMLSSIDPPPKVLNFKALPIITPTPTPTPTPSPSISIQGRVTLEEPFGPGVADVRIYQSSHSSIQDNADVAGRLVAVTNRDGYYKGEVIVGGEGGGIWIWAVKESFIFKPRFHRIEPPFNSLSRSYDFIAFRIQVVPVPEEVPRETPISSIDSNHR